MRAEKPILDAGCITMAHRDGRNAARLIMRGIRFVAVLNQVVHKPPAINRHLHAMYPVLYGPSYPPD